MGARGVGAGRRAKALEQLAKAKPRQLPWKRKGLARAERVIAFLEFLPITKGTLADKRMTLLDGQRAFVEEIYGNLDEDGLRRRSLGIKSEPKGNGKTGLVAGLCLCHLLGPEAETRGEVYSAAIDRQQAGLIFAEMEAIILRVPEFASRVNMARFHKRMEVLEGDGVGSLYEALSSDARRAHGLAPSLFAYDELAQAKDRVLLDNLVNGLGKRKEALGLIISTQAPDDEHPLSELIDQGLEDPDGSTFVQLLAAPEDADPFDQATWLACNPALGKFLSLKEMRVAAARARDMPAFEPAFRNLRLNQRVHASDESRLVTVPVWAQGNPPDGEKPRAWYARMRAELKGRTCFAGLDLSGKHDLTALVLAFPDDEPEPNFTLLPFFWTPEGQLAGRKPEEAQRFRAWIEAGFLQKVPGPVIKFSTVARQLVALKREFDLQVIAYDRWRIDDFKEDLAEVDPDFEVPLEPFGQTGKEMGPAIEWFVELALTGRLKHGGNPVLTASVVNAITVPDRNENLVLDKPKSNRRSPVRIDGAVAALMALAKAKRFEGAPTVNLDEWLAHPVMV